MSEKYQNLEQALQAKVKTEKGKELPVSKIIDIDQIALAVEEKAGAKNLRVVLANIEKNIFSVGEISDKIKEPNKAKLRQGIAKALETVFNSLEFFEEQVIEGSLMGEFPEGVKGKNPSAEDVSNAVEVIRNLIISYIEAIKEFYQPEELTAEQQQLFGVAEENAEAKNQDPKDLVEFFGQVAEIDKRLTEENDLNGDFFDPREEYKETGMSAIKFVRDKVAYFDVIYDLSAQGDPEKRLKIVGLIDNYIKPTRELIVRLERRIELIEEKELKDWKATIPQFSTLETQLKGFEDATNGISLDGSVDVSTNLSTLSKTTEELSEAIESSEYATKGELFRGLFARYHEVLGLLQIAQYRFLLKDLLKNIADIEAINTTDLKKKRSKEKLSLLEKLDESRHTVDGDLLGNSFFATQLSDLYGVQQAAQERAQKIADEIRTRFDRVHQRLDEEKVTSVVLEKFRGMNLQSLIKDWHTKDIAPDDEPRIALEIAFAEKLDEMEAGFIEHAMNNGDSDTEAKQRYENFKKLYEQLYGLVFFGIMRGDAMNSLQGTAKHEEILKFANTPGAMATNVEFNKNPLVGSVGETLHHGEMYGPDMGILQMIAFAAFQEMKGLRSKFTRNQGYTAGMIEELIETVCNREDVVMWDSYEPGATTVLAADHPEIGEQVNIKAELAKYPSEVIEMIKMFAKWKISRDDLGSKAAIWHWGRNKGAFKKNDGVSDKQADGWLAGQCYQVGKNGKKQGHLAALGFVTPEKTEFMAANHENDGNIELGIEKVDQYLLYRFPQLRGVMYRDAAPGGSRLEGLHKYTPENWWEDFPGLEHFFNKTDTVFTGNDYVKSRDAVFKIIEMATESVYIEVPNDTEDLETFLNAVVTSFDTQIGMALAYIGKFNDHSEGYSSSYPVNELNYVHELILAAMKFYLMNILVRIPVHINLNKTIPDIVSKGKNTFPILETADMDYHSNYRIAIETLVDLISRNSTLATFYQKELTGIIKRTPRPGGDGFDVVKRSDRVTPFLDLDFKAVFRDENVLAGKYRKWLVKKKDEELVNSGHHKMRWQERDKLRLGKPEAPYHFKIGAFLSAEKGQLH